MDYFCHTVDFVNTDYRTCCELNEKELYCFIYLKKYKTCALVQLGGEDLVLFLSCCGLCDYRLWNML